MDTAQVLEQNQTFTGTSHALDCPLPDRLKLHIAFIPINIRLSWQRFFQNPILTYFILTS